MDIPLSIDKQIAIRRTIDQKLVLIETLEAQIEIEQAKMNDYCKKIHSYEKRAERQTFDPKKQVYRKRQPRKTKMVPANTANPGRDTLSISRLQEPPIPATLLPLLRREDVDQIDKSLKETSR